MNIEDFLDIKMKEFEMRKALTKPGQELKIGKQFHDTNSNYIEKEENIRKITLDSFSRNTVESSFNFYQQNNIDNSPTSLRSIKRGYIYRNIDGEVACKVIVDSKNNKNYITELYVSDRYKGYGLAKDLLSVAKINLGANYAYISRDDHFTIELLTRNGFRICGKQKSYLILKDETMDNLRTALYLKEDMYREYGSRNSYTAPSSRSGNTSVARSDIEPDIKKSTTVLLDKKNPKNFAIKNKMSYTKRDVSPDNDDTDIEKFSSTSYHSYIERG